MTSDAKFRNWRKSRDPREIELRRKFHVFQISSEISYFSEEKKKAALENVMQFLEFLTTAEATSDVWIKINGAIESREIS